MKNIKSILPILIIFFLGTTVFAQDETRFLIVDYLKVEADNHNDYRDMEAAWKRIHNFKKKAGAIDGWSLFSVLYPTGDHVEYNYVVYQLIIGSEKLAAYHETPFMPPHWKSLLTEEELALVDRTSEIRTMVKSEVWQIQDGIYADDWQKATVQVCNFFEIPRGRGGSEHQNVELDIWKPIHQARITDGKMQGWDLSTLVFPYGANQPYTNSTVDVYENMEQMLTPYDLEEYMKKVHPSKSMDKLMEKTQSVSSLIIAEVRQLVDRLE